MHRYIIATLSTLILLCTPVATHAQAFTNDCTLKFQGSYRKAVKNRVAADGTDYTIHNNGEAISVKDWVELVCGFDSAISPAAPIAGARAFSTILQQCDCCVSRRLISLCPHSFRQWRDKSLLAFSAAQHLLLVSGRRDKRLSGELQ
jgi:hypothetical protein